MSSTRVGFGVQLLARLVSLATCVGVLAGCGILQSTPVEHSPSAPALARLAYVGADDQIYIAEADGSNPRQVTREIGGLSTDQGWAYRWPTYSPDGRRLAFAGYRTGASQLLSAAVVTADLTQGSATALLESSGMATVYLYWSPDSRHLAALLQHGNDLELHLFDATGQEQARQLAVGQPLYWSWARDGNALALHVGDASSGDAWVGVLHLAADGVHEERFADTPSGFRAPAWSWSGGKLAYAVLGGGVSLLTVRDPNGQVTRIASSAGDVAFNWSPTGDWLAFAEADPTRPGLYRGLEVAHADGTDRHRLSQDALVAFFWSPDSARVALVGVDTAARALTWTIVTTDGKSTRPLSSFLPSSDFSFQLPFFDQYAQSTSVWSPDGRRIVYGANTAADALNGGDPQGERVVILDVEGQARAAAVAAGGSAVWSPPALH